LQYSVETCSTCMILMVINFFTHTTFWIDAEIKTTDH
jgi:hypothetical protein